jgi:hypothetical protein
MYIIRPYGKFRRPTGEEIKAGSDYAQAIAKARQLAKSGKPNVMQHTDSAVDHVKYIQRAR